tara:strand:- start:5 stop:535 length:531 start_codon:yes stop_codon:yes gene_type:complete
MDDIRIFDNVVPLDLIERLDRELSFNHPWFFSTDFSDAGVGPVSLGTVYKRKWFSDEVENPLLNILSSIGYSTDKCYRSFYNCFQKLDNPQYHEDPGGHSYMFYLNKEWHWYWGAPTLFKTKKGIKRIYPKPGRLVVFDAYIEHKGTAPTLLLPNRIPGRLSLVFHEKLDLENPDK